ncbi:cation:proton antiporter [Clostridiaceae bacterium HSG29]|nr:cation:proton antiporter [Clostridiaceae bacterium HSG29]
MDSELIYIFNIAIILLVANIGGMISKKFNQPEVLGQIVAGIILGAGLMAKTEIITEIGEIGVIFLMFIAGLETDIDELKESGKSSSMIALMGVLVPGILVGTTTYLLTNNFEASIFMGIISTATSVSISVQTLKEIKRLRSKEGVAILGAAIIDDVIGIILLTLSVGILKPSEGASLKIVIGKIVLFFVIIVIAGKVLRFLLIKFKELYKINEKIVSFALIVCLLLAFLSEELGVAAITGAFFAGVVFSMTEHRHKVTYEINKIASLFFIPIFFVVIGMGVDLKQAFSALGLGSIIILAAVIAKVIGCGFGARISGFDSKQSLQIGIGMVPRAEVAIIISNLGLSLGIINENMMAITILLVVSTTLVTPSMLKWSFER